MVTPQATPTLGRAKPGWAFALLWLAASTVGALLYFLPVGVVWFVVGLDGLNDPQGAADLGAGRLVLAAVLCGGACGSTIGLAQGLVLRPHLRRLGPWLVATMTGYGSLGLLIVLGAALQPEWLGWAATLIVNGKFHWLARVLTEWPGSYWPAGALTLTAFGGVLGFAQWRVLRGHVRRAGWWVPINVAGWALVAVLYLPPFDSSAAAYAFFVPCALAGAGLVWLLRRPLSEGKPVKLNV